MPYKAEDVYHPMEKRPGPDRPSWENLTGILINLEYSFPLNPIAVYDSHRLTDTARLQSILFEFAFYYFQAPLNWLTPILVLNYPSCHTQLYNDQHRI